MINLLDSRDVMRKQLKHVAYTNVYTVWLLQGLLHAVESSLENSSMCLRTRKELQNAF